MNEIISISMDQKILLVLSEDKVNWDEKGIRLKKLWWVENHHKF